MKNFDPIIALLVIACVSYFSLTRSTNLQWICLVGSLVVFARALFVFYEIGSSAKVEDARLATGSPDDFGIVLFMGMLRRYGWRVVIATYGNIFLACIIYMTPMFVSMLQGN